MQRRSGVLTAAMCSLAALGAVGVMARAAPGGAAPKEPNCPSPLAPAVLIATPTNCPQPFPGPTR